MFVLITCPECGKTMKVMENKLGSDATCPACGHVFPTEAEAIEEPIAEEVSEAEELDEENVNLAEAHEMPHAEEIPHAEASAEDEVFHAEAVAVEPRRHEEPEMGHDEEFFEAAAVPAAHAVEAEEMVENVENSDRMPPMEQLLHPEDSPADDVLEEEEEPPVERKLRSPQQPRPRGKRSTALLVGVGAIVILVAGSAAVYFRDGSTPTGGNGQPVVPPLRTEGTNPPGDNKHVTPPEPASDPLEALKSRGLTVEEKDGKIIAATTSDKFTDADFAVLAKHLGDVQALTVRSPITDEGLQYLAGLKSLRRLDLSGQQQVHGSGLAQLTGLSNLEEINLSKTGVTNAGLAHLGGFSSLQNVNLAQTSIGDAGVAHLQGLRNLRKVSLAGTKVSDAGLTHLKRLTKLDELTLKQTPINGAGLANLRFCSKLRVLDLSSTKVNDAALANVQLLKGLEVLSLDKTAVTKTGLAKLKKAMPKVQIN